MITPIYKCRLCNKEIKGKPIDGNWPEAITSEIASSIRECKCADGRIGLAGFAGLELDTKQIEE